MENVALFMALDQSDLKKIEESVISGADPNAENLHQWTPLIIAVMKDNGPMTDLLLKLGADVNLKKVEGKTALMWATSRESSKIVRKLLKAGADVNLKDDNGWGALSYAACGVSSNCVQDLLDAGADVNENGKMGESPLGWAAFYGNDEIVDLLLSHGALPSRVDGYGKTADMIALEQGHTSLAIRLIAAREALTLNETAGAAEPRKTTKRI